MSPTDKIDNLIKQLKTPASPELDQRIDALIEQSAQQPDRPQNIWSRIMKSNITKAAAAIILVVAGIFSLIFLDITIPKAYALEDTIKAYKSIRWLHVSMTNIFVGGEERTTDVWVEYDEQGNTSRLRHQVSTGGPLVGPLTITNNFQNEDVWLPQHNVRLLGHGNPESLLPYKASELDPKLLFETLSEQQKQGQAIVKINEPSEKSEPITVTVTYPPGSRSENRQKVFYIDQATKLVTRIEKYEVNDQELRLYLVREFYDYNQPIDPMMFTLDDEIPEDAQTIDMTGIEEGLPQGDMTKEEVTIEVTRQFFEAAKIGDYDRAGQLFMNVPGVLVERAFAGTLIKEILPLGPVHPSPDPDSDIMTCSCKLLVESIGGLYEVTLDQVYVSPVSGQPDRWVMSGTTSTSATVPASGPISLSPAQNGLNDVTYHELVSGELMQKWLLLDPVPIQVRGDTLFPSDETQKIAFDEDLINVSEFNPVVSIDGKNYQWSLLENDFGVIDLGKVDENWYQMTYAWAQIEMPEETRVELGIGSDDSVKVWLNGELVHENWTTRGIDYDNDRVPVTFKKGMNQLVLKIQNGGGPWGFCCRVLSSSVLNPEYGISAEGLTQEEACYKIVKEFWGAVNEHNFERIRKLVPLTAVLSNEQIIAMLGLNASPIKLLEMGEIYQDESGQAVPCTIQLNGQNIVINLIVMFREIDGKTSCVIFKNK